MISPTRNQAYAALFNLVALAPGNPFATNTRKARDPAKIGAEEFPFFCQIEHLETFAKVKRGMPMTREWRAKWVLWFKSDPTDPADLPTVAMNDYMDFLETCAQDFTNPNERQTLGDLVDWVTFDGDPIKVPGDEEGLGLIMIPIIMYVPGLAGTPGGLL